MEKEQEITRRITNQDRRNGRGKQKHWVGGK
jgi:hypothetical protein